MSIAPTLDTALAAVTSSHQQMQRATESVASGDVLAGLLESKVAKVTHSAAVAVVRSEDERLQTLVDLL